MKTMVIEDHNHGSNIKFYWFVNNELGLMRESGLFFRDVSETAISSLPNSILGELQKLIAESSYDFKKLPHPELLPKLRQANLTYPSHCCAFKNIHRNRWALPPSCRQSTTQWKWQQFGNRCSRRKKKKEREENHWCSKGPLTTIWNKSGKEDWPLVFVCTRCLWC